MTKQRYEFHYCSPSYGFRFRLPKQNGGHAYNSTRTRTAYNLSTRALSVPKHFVPNKHNF